MNDVNATLNKSATDFYCIYPVETKTSHAACTLMHKIKQNCISVYLPIIACP